VLFVGGNYFWAALSSSNVIQFLYAASATYYVQVGSTTYTPGDIYSQIYDGTNVKYCINGIILYTVPLASSYWTANDGLYIGMNTITGFANTYRITNVACYSTGTAGATGVTGPSMSYLAGTIPYATNITSTLNTVETAIYEVGPVIVTSTSTLLIMLNLCFNAATYSVQCTVGRYTASGATAAQSTNIVTQTTPVTLPGPYVAILPQAGSGNNDPTHINGFAMDTLSAGTYYYRIWAASSDSHTYMGLSAALSVLKVG
jgi:hypothetical protein